MSEPLKCRVFASNQMMGCYAALVPTVGFSGRYFKQRRRIRDFLKKNGSMQ